MEPGAGPPCPPRSVGNACVSPHPSLEAAFADERPQACRPRGVLGPERAEPPSARSWRLWGLWAAHMCRQVTGTSRLEHAFQAPHRRPWACAACWGRALLLALL